MVNERQPWWRRLLCLMRFHRYTADHEYGEYTCDATTHVLAPASTTKTDFYETGE